MSSSSASSSGSSSSGFCAWGITDITYIADNEMTFVLSNIGTVNITFTSIDIAVDPGLSITIILPPRPFTITPSGTQLVTVTTLGLDLRGTGFTVTGSCGTQSGTFPNAP
jgi:hypothetical protein